MAKSPFVTKEVHTYTYPEPYDPKVEAERVENIPGYQNRIDPEVVDEDPPHTINIRIPRSRADVDAVADFTQSLVTFSDDGDGAKVEQRIARSNRGLFELLVEEWSFDAECNGANYARLTDWSGDWVTACLADAVRLGTNRDYAKKTSNSSAKPKASRSGRQSPPSTE